MIWKLLLITAVLIGIAVAGIAIKMFLKKDGEFKKQCGSTDPTTGQKIGCSCGGGEGSCENNNLQTNT
ncbi:MAG: membrane or secreted protein [Bacteroidota bacterium]|nr:membrane or secreted protein [Bacteroidota bacterium]